MIRYFSLSEDRVGEMPFDELAYWYEKAKALHKAESLSLANLISNGEYQSPYDEYED